MGPRPENGSSWRGLVPRDRELGLKCITGDVAALAAPGMGRANRGLRRARLAGDLLPGGIAHSIVAGTAWEPTPWQAVQRAAA
jgi:hypothetical protein